MSFLSLSFIIFFIVVLIGLYWAPSRHLRHCLIGSPQEFVKSGILRSLPGFLKSDVFGVGHGHAACFQ